LDSREAQGPPQARARARAHASHRRGRLVGPAGGDRHWRRSQIPVGVGGVLAVVVHAITMNNVQPRSTAENAFVAMSLVVRTPRPDLSHEVHCRRARHVLRTLPPQRERDRCVTRAAPLARSMTDVSATRHPDVELSCARCGERFVYTAGEQELDEFRALTRPPRECPKCRRLQLRPAAV